MPNVWRCQDALEATWKTLARWLAFGKTVELIGDERLLEGWAAFGAQSCPAVLGLTLVTDARLIFVDTGGGMMAFPILKISTAEVTSPCEITFTAWFGQMSLRFDTPAALSSVLNLVRQDPAWGAVEINLARPPGHRAGLSLVEDFDMCGRAAVEPLVAA